jgi:hypothetical protein
MPEAIMTTIIVDRLVFVIALIKYECAAEETLNLLP